MSEPIAINFYFTETMSNTNSLVVISVANVNDNNRINKFFIAPPIV